MNRFNVIKSVGSARVGVYETANGTFQTPNFMPVGTIGSVKGVDAERLIDVGAQIILVNTYHLWLRPGSNLVNHLGGIHRFAGWKGPILSDSGGFQIFSLKGFRQITEDGVTFQSHLDGSKRFLSPEIAIQIQEELGVNIAMVLDECPAAEMERRDVERSLEMTLRWARRSLHARTNPDTSIFAITQGGMHRDLRTKSIEGLLSIHHEDPAAQFDGFAIGGLSVGEEKDVMYEVLSYHPGQLPQDRIRYLMGVGTPQDLVNGVRNGVDLFDCVMPTRSGRFGRAFISGDEPWINIKNSRFARDADPLDSSCQCLACRNYSKGYIHHLMKCEEMLGPQLLSIHNLAHYLGLMSRIRSSINDGTFESQVFDSIDRIWRDFDRNGGNEGPAKSL